MTMTRECMQMRRSNIFEHLYSAKTIDDMRHIVQSGGYRAAPHHTNSLESIP